MPTEYTCQMTFTSLQPMSMSTSMSMSMTMIQTKVTIKNIETELRGKRIPIPPKVMRKDMTNDEYIAFLQQLLHQNQQTLQRDRPPLIQYFCQSEEEMCTICMECIQPMDDVSSFTCKHYLHSHCLVGFLQSRSQVHKCCPLCREEDVCFM